MLAQLEGSGRGGLASYDRDLYAALDAAVAGFQAATAATAPPPPPGLTRADAWVSDLARVHRGAALRVMEVRAAYADRDFEWDAAARLAAGGLADANVAIQRRLAMDALTASGGGGE